MKNGTLYGIRPTKSRDGSTKFRKSISWQERIKASVGIVGAMLGGIGQWQTTKSSEISNLIDQSEFPWYFRKNQVGKIT